MPIVLVVISGIEINLEMKTNKKIRRFTEPLVYIILVASFGFISEG